MYRKILVPLDGSKLAEAVLPHVCALAERLEAEIVLLRVPVAVEDDVLFTGPKLAAITTVRMDALRGEAIDYLEKLAAELEDAGLRVTILVSEGLVAETIVDCAKKVHADLIAISTCGRGGPGHQVMGSVTYQLLHRAGMPILMVCAESSKHEAAGSGRTLTGAVTKANSI